MFSYVNNQIFSKISMHNLFIFPKNNYLAYVYVSKGENMNKKGLIFVLLFVVSAIGVVAFTDAKTNDNKVNITINYFPDCYVDMGGVWVDIDKRLLSDFMVFTEGDIIDFMFYYDLAFVSFAGGANAYGGGFQPDYWFYEPQNPDLTYNETRLAGQITVFLDEYDLGQSNFDISGAQANTYQDIQIELDIGWHFLTIVLSELVSNDIRTEWHWEYAQDQVKFYVVENRDDIIPLRGLADNMAIIDVEAVESRDLFGYYNWTSWADIRPSAEAAQYTDDTLGNEILQYVDPATKANASIHVIYNASDTELVLLDGASGPMFADFFSVGPSNYTWLSTTQGLQFDETPMELVQGVNYIYFIVSGLRADDYSLHYANYYPSLRHATAIFKVVVGIEPEEPTETSTVTTETTIVTNVTQSESTTETGPLFGILISVSTVGLVAAVILRRRK